MGTASLYTLYAGGLLFLLGLWPAGWIKQLLYLLGVGCLVGSISITSFFPAQGVTPYVPSPYVPTPIVPAPVVVPVDAFGVQVAQAFVAPPSSGTKAEAQQMAALFDGYARWLAYDGLLDKPAVNNTREFGQSFANLQQNVMLMDKPFKDKYAVMERLIFAQLPVRDKTPEGTPIVAPFSQEKRSATVAVFNQVSAALRSIK